MSEHSVSNRENHRQIEPLLAVYRALDDVRRRRVDEHVRKCKACAQQLQDFHAVDRQLSSLRQQDQARLRARLQRDRPDLGALRAQRDVAVLPALQRLVASLEQPQAVVGSLIGLVLLLAIAGLFATWFAGLRQPAPSMGDETINPVAAVASPPQITCMETDDVIDVIPEFELVSRREVAADADAIFVGTVTAITCDGWNQDGGEYWEVEMNEVLPQEEVTVLGSAGIPAELVTEDGQVKVVAKDSASILHQVTFQVEEVVLDEVGLGEEAVFTVFGNSPQGEAGPEHDLQVGERVLVYAQRTELPWRDSQRRPQVEVNQNGAFLNIGRREALTFATAYPPLAFLRQSADGLFMPQHPSPDMESGPVSLERVIEELREQRREVEPAATEQAAVRSNMGRVAYIQGGDIWMKELPDGEPRRLTGGGDNDEPRWSPSGQWLAFRKDKFVWVLNIATPEEAYSLQTTAGDVRMGFSWSPAADVLAFTAGNKLQLLEPESNTITTIVSLPFDDEDMYRIIHPFWKPDGEAIAYEQYRIPLEPADTFQGEHGIWLVKLASGATDEVYDSGVPDKGEAHLAGWTTDGRHVLFWQDDVLSASSMMDGAPLYALPVGNAQQVDPVALTVPAAGRAAAPMLARYDFLAPAPHSSEAAIVLGGGRDTWSNKRVGGVSPQTALWRSYTPEDRVAISPAWSPDGRQLAVVTTPERAENMEEAMRVRRIEVWENGDRRQLTDDPAYRDENPMWSAGGSHILFARINEKDEASLWLIPVGGGDAAPQMVVEALSPPPSDTGWFGVYGYVDWNRRYDWWRGPEGLESETAPSPGG